MCCPRLRGGLQPVAICPPPLRPETFISHTLDRYPPRTDDATNVVVLCFGDLVAPHRAMDEECRTRTVSNLIRTLSPKIGVPILLKDVRVVIE